MQRPFIGNPFVTQLLVYTRKAPLVIAQRTNIYVSQLWICWKSLSPALLVPVMASTFG